MRFPTGIALTLTALVILCANAPAQLPNDDCSGAIPVVSGLNGPFTNVGSTTSAPPWSCAAGAMDVWFSYAATTTSVVVADTCTNGQYDTCIEIFDDCTLLNLFSCDDDGCGTLQSSTSAPATAGQTLYIRVGGFSGSTGGFTLNISEIAPLTNDDCASAIAVQFGSNGPFSNIGATTSAPPFSCPITPPGRDVWFSFSSPAPIAVTIDTCTNTTFDTVLEVYDGSCGALNSLACNDDVCSVQSEVTISTVTGGTYFIRVGGYGGSEGNFELALSITGTGSFAFFRTGCGNALLDASGSPNIGGGVTYTLNGALGTPLIWFGLIQLRNPLCPPATCQMGATFDMIFAQSTLSGPVPFDPGLVGSIFYVQGGDLNAPGGCSAGVPLSIPMTVTDTIKTTIG